MSSCSGPMEKGIKEGRLGSVGERGTQLQSHHGGDGQGFTLTGNPAGARQPEEPGEKCSASDDVSRIHQNLG